MRRVKQPPRWLADKEKSIARDVFKNTVPLDQVVITDGLGANDRPFTLPVSVPASVMFNVSEGKYVIHAGDGYYGMSTLDADKALLIHELTHVWQGEQGNHSWSYVLDSLWDQALSDDAYNYDRRKPLKWDEYGPEQQAQIVEDWFKDGMQEQEEKDVRFYYVKHHIRGESVDHDWISAFYAVRPLPHGTLHVDVVAPSLDPVLVPLLEKRFRADDFTGMGARVRELEKLFGSLGPDSSRALLRRLEKRNAQDNVSRLFHDHLSPATIAKLLGLLRTQASRY
ncbi:hypothetical protein JNW90_30770 [Micromonospora sp. STR1s_5]|nr:hypothetical protein [Micromonospora sp. STR1s_5]